MHYCGLAVLVCASLAAGQAPAPKPPAPKPAPAATPSNSAQTAPEPKAVAPDAAVITVTGVCKDAAAPKPDCKVVVTRAEFEKIADALSPTMTAAQKRQLANSYAQLLISSNAAEQRGLGKGVRFETLMHFARMQVLQQQLQQALQQEANQITEPEVEQYYKGNPESFEYGDLRRLFVPKVRVHSGDGKDKAKDAKAGEAGTEEETAKETDNKELADSMRARLLAGEDFDKLQKEVYDKLGLKTPVPLTNIGRTVRGNLPATQRAVLELKPGEVSEVFSEAAGYYVYKLVSKEVPPLEQVRGEVQNTLRNQKLQDLVQALRNSATMQLNDDYFVVPAQTAPGLAAPVPAKPPAKPGAPSPHR
jgi:bifunctional DNA-binding transcriptional regulator/antitoxin component of YhaV-PrlF toxin-antitoxin module